MTMELCAISSNETDSASNSASARLPETLHLTHRLQAPSKSFLSPLYPHTNLVSCLLYDQSAAWRPPGWYKQHYMSDTLSTAKGMRSVDLVGHHGCVNSLDFSPHGHEFLASAGDDRRVLVWRMGEVTGRSGNGMKPLTVNTDHMSNIFSASFSCDGAFIYTGGDDADMMKHDFTRFQTVNSQEVGVYHHYDSVYCVSAHPSCPHTVLTASEDGCVYIIDTRQPVNMVHGDMALCDIGLSVQSVAINPVEPCLVAVATNRFGVALYDTRQRKKVRRYQGVGSVTLKENAVSVCFNKTGEQLFALYRGLSPCLFDLHEPKPVQCFVNDSYRNMVTLKSGCFMGPHDEYVVSGSDDFRVYIWKVAPRAADSGKVHQVSMTEPHLILPGHRSIVNQVRYSSVHQTMATSGVEKVVKVWSHHRLRSDDVLHNSGDPPSRQRFSLSQQLRIVDDENVGSLDSVEEDTSVLALFDSLVVQAENGELPSSSFGSFSSEDDWLDRSEEETGPDRFFQDFGRAMIWNIFTHDFEEGSWSSDLSDDLSMDDDGWDSESGWSVADSWFSENESDLGSWLDSSGSSSSTDSEETLSANKQGDPPAPAPSSKTENPPDPASSSNAGIVSDTSKKTECTPSCPPNEPGASCPPPSRPVTRSVANQGVTPAAAGKEQAPRSKRKMKKVNRTGQSTGQGTGQSTGQSTSQSSSKQSKNTSRGGESSQNSKRKTRDGPPAQKKAKVETTTQKPTSPSAGACVDHTPSVEGRRSSRRKGEGACPGEKPVKSKPAAQGEESKASGSQNGGSSSRGSKKGKESSDRSRRVVKHPPPGQGASNGTASNTDSHSSRQRQKRKH